MREYLTIPEAAAAVGVSRATLYRYMEAMHIHPRKFGVGHKLYIARTDVTRLKEYKEQPWLAEAEGADTPDVLATRR